MTPFTIQLCGSVNAVQRALDRLYVGADVRGVLEHSPSQVDVAVVEEGAPVAELLARIDGLEWRALAPSDGPSPTGFEEDGPIVVSAGLLVRPPWVPALPDFRGLELVVPRGMAFGSGEHGSTQAALLALEASWREPPPRSFADVGSGSGVLALYARLRGAATILACDVEENAVRAARELLPGADVRLGGPEVWPAGHADAVVANLDDAQLDAALEAILALWNRRGPLVLSGMRAVRVDHHVRVVGSTPSFRCERGGFVGLAFPGHPVRGR